MVKGLTVARFLVAPITAIGWMDEHGEPISRANSTVRSELPSSTRMFSINAASWHVSQSCCQGRFGVVGRHDGNDPVLSPGCTIQLGRRDRLDVEDLPMVIKQLRA